MKMLSTLQKVEKLRSLRPGDLTNWEQGFQATLERMALAGDLSKLTDPQLDIVDRIYEKHFS